MRTLKNGLLSSLRVLALLPGLFFAQSVLAQVSLPNGTVGESAVDLRVKVLGGLVTVDRQFHEGRWQLNLRWKPAVLGGDPQVQGSCTAYPQIVVQDRRYDGDGEAWALENRYSIRATDYFAGAECGANRIKTLRWQDRNTGNWMEYQRSDAGQLQFNLIRYGDRNAVSVSLTYDAQGKLKDVRDHFGSVVLTYTYSGDLLSEIRDNPGLIPGNTAPARSVKYAYTATTYQGQSLQTINKVTDVSGNTTQYTIANGTLTGVTDPEGRTRSYQYTADRVTQSTDADGHKTTYVYDYDKQKKEFYVRVTGPAGLEGSRIVETWYDTDGIVIRRDVNGQTHYQKGPTDSATRSTIQTDAAGRKTETVKDEFGNVVKTLYPDGAVTSATYASLHGGVLQETDELGVKTAYAYDAKGNLLKKTEAAGTPEQRITDYERDAYGQITKETRKGGSLTLPNGQTVATPDASIAYHYDDRGNRSQLTDPLGNISTYQYDIQGNVTQLTDAKGNVWKHQYDARGQRTQSTDPLNKTTHYLYDKVGNLISRTDALGNVTHYTYDKQNRLIATKDALGNTRSRRYDVQGQLTATLDALGKTQASYKYDLAGRLIETQDAAGNATTTVFDAQSGVAPTQLVYPTFTRTFTYDTRDRVTQTQDVTTGDNPLTVTSATAYDPKGQPTQTTDRTGQVTQLAYDGLGRLIQVTDATSGITRFSYDARDNLLAVTDANGNTTRYDYDPANRRIKEIRPLGQSQTYGYDAAGNLIEVKDAKGNQIHLTYDAAHHRTQETHTLASSQSASRTIAYTWNDAGALTGYTDANGGHADHLAHSASYSLDALGRKTQETVTLGGQSLTLKTAYAATGKKASQTWPDASQIDYGWDDAQRLTDLTLPGAGTLSTQSFDAWNQAQSQLYPGGGTRTHDYDGFARLSRIRVKSPSQVTLMQRGYSYDNESNITALTTEQGDNHYQYDALYRLTNVATGISGLPSEQYTYDKLGNRLTDTRRPNPTQGDKTWRYDGNNQLTESATEDTGLIVSNSKPVSHSYDANGSLIRKATPNGTQAQYPTDNQKYQYDAANRLTEVQDPDGHLIASYQYDPLGRRIRKTLHRTWDGSAWTALAQKETHTYVYAEEGLAAEYQANGSNAPQLISQYGWKPDGLWGTDPVWLKTTKEGENEAEYFYYQNDHLGTPQQVIDVQGNVVWRQKATAFGETTVDPSSTITNNLRFPGQYYDQETHTHQNYFRDYSSNIGRYVESDPIGLAGGINTYMYVGGNPLGYADPRGLNPGTAVGAGIGSFVAPGLGTVIGAAIGTAIGVGIGWWIIESRASGQEKLPITKPGRDCAGNCKPCPPGKAPWQEEGNQHGSTSGFHWHRIIYNQNKNDEECTCNPVRQDSPDGITWR